MHSPPGVIFESDIEISHIVTQRTPLGLSWMFLWMSYGNQAMLVKNHFVKEQPFDQSGNEILAKEPIPQEEGTSEEPEDVDELTQKVAMKGKGKRITHKETCSTSRRLSNNIPKVRLKRYLKMRGAHGAIGVRPGHCHCFDGMLANVVLLILLGIRGVMGTKEHMRLTIEVYHNLKCDFDIVGNESIGEEVDKILTELLDELNIDEYEIDEKGLDTEVA
ncbi:hypothetical protein Tco_0120961 [Tanacetum coccineum]